MSCLSVLPRFRLASFPCFSYSRCYKLTFMRLHSFFTRSMQLAGPDLETAFSDEEFRKRLVRWVVRNDQPFTAVEASRQSFRSMFNLTKPGIAIPSGNTIKRDIMECHREEEGRVGERLRNAGSKISVTLDCWTSPNTKAFLGITGHYIDDDWALRSLLLDFVPLPGEHTGENLCEAFVAACERFGILHKLLGVTTDNAANIDKLLTCLEGACHDRGITFAKKRAAREMRCSCHESGCASVAARVEGRRHSRPIPASTAATATQDSGSMMSCIAKLRRLVC